MTRPKPAAPGVRESEFTRTVIQLARLYGWKAVHFRPGLNRRGVWATQVQGDGVGFVDLVLVKPGRRVLWVELKTDAGSLTEAQKAWGLKLAAAGEDWRCWRPAQWEHIVKELKR